MAREYAADDEFRGLLILDTYAYSPEKGDPKDIEINDRDDELFEKAVSLAAGLIARFINDGASVEFLTPEIHIQADSGDGHLYRILESLAIIRRQTTANLFHFADSGLRDARAPGGFASVSPAVALQKLISNQAFCVILTQLSEEKIPTEIRRFARVISF